MALGCSTSTTAWTPKHVVSEKSAAKIFKLNGQLVEDSIGFYVPSDNGARLALANPGVGDGKRLRLGSADLR